MILQFGQSDKVTDLVVAGLYCDTPLLRMDGIMPYGYGPRKTNHGVKVRFALVYLFGLKGIRSL